MPSTTPLTTPKSLSTIFRSRRFSPTSTTAQSAYTQVSTPLEAAASSPTSPSFSTGTVIALSTVLPTIILVLLGVIFYLLRIRRKSSSYARSRENFRNQLPMADIRPVSENVQPEPSFVALSHRAVSPFNLSLHELSQSLFFGGGVAVGRNVAGSTKTSASFDSGLAHNDAQLPSLPPIALTRPEPPPTPVLAVRYPSKPTAADSRTGNRTSIYVDRTSVDSAPASSVIFARERTEEGSAGNISRDELRQWGSRDGRTSRSEYNGWPPPPSSSQHSTSNTLPTEGHGIRASGRSTSKALRMLGIGPSSPLEFPLSARVHSRSQSQPAVTYGLPSLQLSPRVRALRGWRQPPSEVNSQGDIMHSPSAWSGRAYGLDNRAEFRRIHTPILSSPQPSPAPDLPSTSRTSPPRERQPLSITIPPRLGAPIRPAAELIALQSSSPQPTPRTRIQRAPRSRSESRASGIVSAGLSDLGVLERTHAAFSRPRGMSDSEPSPRTRERILRLLGRLPEDSQDESASNSQDLPSDARTPHLQGSDRAREVRRTRSESGLLSAFVEQSSDA